MEQHESQSSQSDLFDSDSAWDFLSELIDRFCTRWESAPPVPEFAAFAKELEPITHADFRRIGLIELVKVEFEFRSGESHPWRELGWYLNAWPELGSSEEPPGELVNEERRLGPSSRNSPGNREGKKASLLTDLEPDVTHTRSIHRAREVRKFNPGDSVDDFDLLAQLGHGAFATVFLARQVSMQRLVALKISADEGHEGPTLAKLSHPNIVRVFDQRTLPEKSLRLMYMEYVAGGSLADVIKHSKVEDRSLDSTLFLEVLDRKLANAGSSPPVESSNRNWLVEAAWPRVVAKIGAQIAGAVAYTHSEGVLHRDIKPANILLDEHGHPKLVDFNISYGNEVIGATAASSFGGSLSYMSPEQLEAFTPAHKRTAEEVDGGCDVYALGVSLHELLTGRRPFEEVIGCEPLELIDQMMVQRKQGLDENVASNLKAKDHLLGLAIESCLSPDSQSRPNVAALQQRLQWASDKQVCEYLQPPKRSWSNWSWAACQYPWPFIIATVFGVALFATWFIITYNVTTSVEAEDQSLFLETRQMINRVVFPLAFVFLIGMFYRTQRLLRAPGRSHSESQFTRAIVSNLDFGHSAALMCIAMWTIAGLLYPIVLSAKGAALHTSAWADFPISHLLAGLISGAFVFFGLTMLSVAAWHPRLVMSAMKQDIFVDPSQPVNRIRRRLYMYRVLAIGAPLIGIATLVNFRTSNTFAVSCLSVGAIIGLLAMAYAIRKIGTGLDLIVR